MTRLLGFADIVAGLLFLASFYQIDIPRGLMIAFGVYLIIKGLVFLMNFFSLIDIACGVLLLLGFAISLPSFVVIGLAAFLSLKGLASLFAFS